MAEDDLMVALAKSLVEDEPGIITSLNSAFGEEDDFVTDFAPADDFLDALDVLGLLPPPAEAFEPDVVKELSPPPVSFLDEPVTLGKGRGKRVVPAGTALLFPELMALAEG